MESCRWLSLARGRDKMMVARDQLRQVGSGKTIRTFSVMLRSYGGLSEQRHVKVTETPLKNQ